MYAELRARPRDDAAGHTTHPSSTDTGAPSGDHTRTPRGESPYRPLTAYTESDAAVFAGRTDLRRRLHLRVTAGEGVVVLLGPSGAGKTSLLRAGLVPEVRATGLRTRTDRVDATTVFLTPGSDAVGSLAEAVGVERSALERPGLERSGLDDVSAAADLVAASDVVSVSPGGRHRACLLVVDRVEDLFRWCAAADRALFLRLLDTLAGDDRFAVVVGLSAEFSAEALAEPVLTTALDTRSVVLTPMTTAEVVEAVELPARVAGVRTETGLGEAIAADLARLRPGTPPLIALGVMLDHLWHTRIAESDTPMTLEAYRASDPVDEITAIAADRTWSRFTPVDRDTARIVLLAAADGSPSARDTTLLLRRIARPHLDRVLTRLTESHLVRTVEGRVELTHPALISAWPRLGWWVAQRRVQAPVRDRVLADAIHWAEGGRPGDELYDADRLRRAETALDPFDDLGPDAAAFLERSRDRLRLRRSRRRVLLTLGVLVSIVSLVLAIVFGAGVRRSDADRDAARLAALVDRSTATAQTDPSASASAARAAFAAGPDDRAAESAVLATQTRPLARLLGVGTTRSVATPTSGPTALSVVAGPDGSLGVVDATGPSASAADAGVADGAQTVAVSGTTAATIDTDGGLRLWRIGIGARPVPIATVPTPRPAVAVVATADADRFAVADASGTVRVLAVDDPARPAVVASAALGATPTALASGPSVVVVGDANGEVTLIDPRTGTVEGSLPPVGNAVTALAATTGFTAVADGTGRVSVVRTGADGLATAPAADLAGPRGRVGSLSFSPSGPGRPATVLAVTSDGVTDIVDPARPAADAPLTSPLRAPGGITAARFTPDGSLVSAGAGDARRWSLPAGTIPGVVGDAATPSCSVRAICAVPHLNGPVQVVDVRDPLAPVVAGVVDAPDHFDGAAVAPSGMWMMTVDAAHRAQLWDTRTFATPLAVGSPVQLGPGPVGVVAFSPTSSAIAMSRDGGASVGVWSVTPRGLVELADLGLGTPVTAAAWSGDGGQIALGGRSGVLRWTVYATGVGAVSGRIAATTPVTSLGYGEALAQADAGSTARTTLRPVVVVGDGAGGVTRYDVDGGGPLGPRVPLGGAAVTSVAAVGATTATGSADGSVHRIAADGTAVRVADVYPGQGSGEVRVGALDGDRVIAVGDDTPSRVLTLRTADVDDRICRTTGC